MGNEISITDQDQMNSLLSFSKIMATSVCTIPKHFHGKEGDCMAVIMQAARWGMDPYQVASKTHVVNGNLGYEAQLVNAVVSSSTAIVGGFEIEYDSDEWKNSTDPKAWCRVGAIKKGDTGITWGQKVYPAKQDVKNSPLWKTDPQQQTAYLAIKKWARLHTPAVLLGVYTPDEMEEKAEREINPSAGKTSSIQIPGNVDKGTGEILEPELEEFQGEPESTNVPNLSGMTIMEIKGKINDCETEDYLMLVGVDISNLGNISLEEKAALKSHFDKKLKMMRM